MKRDKGVLVSFEGIDGSGKTTQRRLLLRWLRSNGFKSILVSPTAKPLFGELIKRINKEDIRIPATARELLYAASFACVLEEITKPSLATGLVVITHRYIYSGSAYSGAEGCKL